MIRFACPGCGKKLKGIEGLAGSLTICPRCRRQFTVPSVLEDDEPCDEVKRFGDAVAHNLVSIGDVFLILLGGIGIAFVVAIVYAWATYRPY